MGLATAKACGWDRGKSLSMHCQVADAIYRTHPLNHRRHVLKKLLLATVAACASTLAMAQAPIQVVVPVGVQQNPAGGFVLNGDAWFGDRINGIVHYARNPDGTYAVDLTQGFTIPGAGASTTFGFNYVGQVFQVSPQLALVAIPDNGKGSDNRPVAGVYTLSFAPQFTAPISPVGNLTHLVPDKGLAGATSVALGPDLNPYVGFLRSGNLVRINGNQVESVGGTLNGQPILSLTFNGSDAYLATGDGLYVVPNAPACQGNKDNCGRPVLVAGGATVAVANDNHGHLYFSQSIGIVRRLDLATGAIAQVASGLSFGSITAGLVIDEDGNLLIGELSQIDRILATDLATVQ
jgi:hypothetical protein